jgi:hypothetical protein
MDGYFKLVDDYVELVESKVGELLAAFKKIGVDRALLLRQKDAFFKSLKQNYPKESGDAFQNYFDLVDYYVATSNKVIKMLKEHLKTQRDALTAQKEQLKGVLLNLTEIEQMRDNGLPVIETTKHTDTIIQMTHSYSVATIRSYLDGKGIHFGMNLFLRNIWPEVFDQIQKIVEGQRLMHTYGQMKAKFVKLNSITDLSLLPADKADQFRTAAELFKSYDDNHAIITSHRIGYPIDHDYISVLKDYNEGLKEVKEILLYLQGGVSQAFLILRNTNDIEPRENPEKFKLLKNVKDERSKKDDLVYVDQHDRPIKTQTNNFQKIFNGQTLPETKNNAILSDKNYNVLEAGGTVVIIAYGQSGSGKTYTLTRLIEHFSNHLKEGFSLVNISSIQFYNDVVLENGQRTTATKYKEPPQDPAKRAVFELGQELTESEAIYRKTKIYDIGQLLIHKPKEQYLRLKIEPVVTSVPDLSNPTGPMKLIEMHSKKCFAAAVEVNKLATSHPDLNRVFETYKQLVKRHEHKERLGIINAAYKLFCENRFYLPVYSIQDEELVVHSTYNRFQADLDEFFCSHLSSSSYKKFTLSEADIQIFMKGIDRDIQRDVVATCIGKNVALKEKGDKLVEQYDLFLKWRRHVHILCDARTISKEEPGLFKLDDMYFKDGEIHNKEVRRGEQPVLKLEISSMNRGMFGNEDDYTRYIGNGTHDLLKKNDFDQLDKYPIVLYFYPPKPTGSTLVLTCDKEDEPFYFRTAFQGRIKSYNIDSHLRDGKIKNHSDTLDIFYPLLLESNENGNYREGIISEILKKLAKKEHILSEEIKGDKDSILFELYKLGFQKTIASYLFIPLVPARAVLNSGQRLANWWNPEKSREIEPDANHIRVYFDIIKTGGTPNKITWTKVKPYLFQELAQYPIQNTFKSFADHSQTYWETNPEAFRAKFEYCIKISATGSDNASNYKLFDHEELRYGNYFTELEAQMRAAHITDEKMASTFKVAKITQLKPVYDLINNARFTRAMPQNPESSRSQLVTTLHLLNKGKQSKLVFIDLAGNEKVDTTKKHIVTSESVYINSTLKFVTEMFLRMKEEYPGWKLETRHGKPTYTSLLKNPEVSQFTPPTLDQLDYSRPSDDADPFQRFLYDLSTPTTVGLKPAIVMIVCAYEYYSFWDPPIPSPDVSKESLSKTFQFISDLFDFDAQRKEGGTRPFRRTDRRKRVNRTRQGKRTRKF